MFFLIEREKNVKSMHYTGLNHNKWTLIGHPIVRVYLCIYLNIRGRVCDILSKTFARRVFKRRVVII